MRERRPALRDIPSIDRVALRAREQAGDIPRRLLVTAARAEIEGVRSRAAAGTAAPELDALSASVVLRARLLLGGAPRAVVNATGVIVHTNLGRAPLSDLALEAVAAAARGYSDLEFDLESGARGARSMHVEKRLTELTGAESALVLNNNAGAVFLALETHACGREVLVSRGEAVEIGGGFRIPDVLRESGASLRDVGTTNRTRLHDYAGAIGERTAAILRVHRSNFAQIGFTESPPLRDLAGLAHAHGLLLIDDLGSGSLLDTAQFGLEREPLVQESLRAGADLVAFSGDKLLGGPQAGILAGRAAAIGAVATRPLARALRSDKMTIAALSATLGHYLAGDATAQIPVWQMITAPAEQVRDRACRLSEGLPWCEVVQSNATVGGGSLPGQTLPSYAIRLSAEVGAAEDLAARLRAAERPVIGRVHEDLVWLDLRTVLERDEPYLRAALHRLRAA